MELSDITLDKIGSSVPVGEIPFKVAAVKDLPLYIVITNMVYDVDLPQKEFMSDMEFEDYLVQYANDRFSDPKKREKFVKIHQNNALYVDDEIIGEQAYQFTKEVKLVYARMCNLGILKTESKQFYLFQTGLGMDINSQLTAYQALTYGMINKSFLPQLATEDSRKHMKAMVGEKVYTLTLKSLGID